MTPVVQALIAINVAIWFVSFAIWRDLTTVLAFRWAPGEPFRWWTALTFMFVHASAWHVGASVSALWAFGPRLEHAWGAKRFLRFYLLAGLGGLVGHLLFPHGDAYLFGASASVFGVMAAFAFQWPRDEIFLFGVVPLRVWTLVVLFAAVSLTVGIYGTTDAPNVAYLAHLGGFAVAWFYMRTPPGMSIDQLRQRVSQVPDSDDAPPRAIPRTMPRQRERVEEVDEIVAKSKAVAAKHPTATRPSRKRDSKAERQEEMNRVLDKISAEGIDSLTSDERRALEEMAKRLKRG
jgi:membrane associated rhomboid family serine protease